jgi:hypothetical protein
LTLRPQFVGNILNLTSVNTDFEIKNEGQDCKIGTVGEGIFACGREYGGGEGEGIWLTHFVYI